MASSSMPEPARLRDYEALLEAWGDAATTTPTFGVASSVKMLHPHQGQGIAFSVMDGAQELLFSFTPTSSGMQGVVVSPMMQRAGVLSADCPLLEADLPWLLEEGNVAGVKVTSSGVVLPLALPVAGPSQVCFHWDAGTPSWLVHLLTRMGSLAARVEALQGALSGVREDTEQEQSQLSTAMAAQASQIAALQAAVAALSSPRPVPLPARVTHGGGRGGGGRIQAADLRRVTLRHSSRQAAPQRSTGWGSMPRRRHAAPDVVEDPDATAEGMAWLRFNKLPVSTPLPGTFATMLRLRMPLAAVVHRMDRTGVDPGAHYLPPLPLVEAAEAAARALQGTSAAAAPQPRRGTRSVRTARSAQGRRRVVRVPRRQGAGDFSGSTPLPERFERMVRMGAPQPAVAHAMRLSMRNPAEYAWPVAEEHALPAPPLPPMGMGMPGMPPPPPAVPSAYPADSFTDPSTAPAPAGAGGLLASIRAGGGRRLRRTPAPAAVAPTPSRGSLMGAIQAGMQLRRTGTMSVQPLGDAAEPGHWHGHR